MTNSEIDLAEFVAALSGDGEPMRLPDGEFTGTSRNDWQALVDALHATKWDVAVNGNARMPVPVLASDLAEHASLRVMLGDEIQVNIFDWDTIGFDFDINELKSQSDMDLVVEFIRTVGRALAKSATVSPEGYLGERPVLVYDVEVDHVTLLGASTKLPNGSPPFGFDRGVS
jgi:hypothetical protein